VTWEVGLGLRGLRGLRDCTEEQRCGNPSPRLYECCSAHYRLEWSELSVQPKYSIQYSYKRGSLRSVCEAPVHDFSAVPVPVQLITASSLHIPPFLLSAEPCPLFLAQYARHDTMHLVEPRDDVHDCDVGRCDNGELLVLDRSVSEVIRERLILYVSEPDLPVQSP
jgi:hypothetical protein